MRVREAYEFLQAADEGVSSLEARLQIPLPLPSPEPHNDGTAARATPKPYLPRADATAEELSDHAVELLLSDTASVDSVQWTLARLDEKAGKKRVAESLKRAVSKGSRRALLMLLDGAPDDVDETTLDAACRSSDELTRIAVIRYYWLRGDAVNAAKLLERVFAASDAEPSMIPAPGFCLEVVLQCNAKGKHATATALLGAFDDWHVAQADSKDVMGNVAALWQVARELRSLKRCTSPELRQALAWSVLNDDRDRLTEELSKRENAMSNRELERFAQDAPALYAMVRPHLRELLPPPAQRTQQYRRPPTLVSVMVTIGVLSIVHLFPDCSRDHNWRSPRAESQQQLPQGAKEGRGATRDSTPTIPSQTADLMDPAGLIEAARQVGYPSLAARTMTLWAKTQDGECKVSPQELDEFLRVAQLAAGASSELQRPVDTFVGYLASACSSQRRSGVR